MRAQYGFRAAPFTQANLNVRPLQRQYNTAKQKNQFFFAARFSGADQLHKSSSMRLAPVLLSAGGYRGLPAFGP